jgi:phosphoribosylanthranilate isomerase
MIVRVKICGITRLEDAQLAEECGASAVGFVFHPKSPRYIEPKKAGEISQKLGPFIARVGVFVDEDISEVKRISQVGGLSAIQLHGSESPEYISHLEGMKIIKVFRVYKDFSIESVINYRVHAFLFDAYNKNVYGGTGETFDWEKVIDCQNYGRCILAGGLKPSNVLEAVRIVKPWGIDISSGVESEPGIKDPGKVRTLFTVLQKV